MPGEEIFGGPVGAVVAAGQALFGLAKNKREPSVVDIAKKSGDWNNPDALRVLEMQLGKPVTNARTPGAKIAVTKSREFLRKQVTERLGQLEEAGIVPEDDYAGPPDEPEFEPDEPEFEPDEPEFEPDEPDEELPWDYEPIDPGELSPVFGGAAAGIFQRTPGGWKQKPTPSAAVPKVLKAMEADKARQAKTLKGQAKAKVGAARDLSKRIPKVLKPDASVKAGGRAFGPTIAVEVGRRIIEKVSDYAEKRQFAEMEAILKRQQAETNRIIEKARRAATMRAPVQNAPRQPPAARAALPGRNSVLGRSTNVATVAKSPGLTPVITAPRPPSVVPKASAPQTFPQGPTGARLPGTTPKTWTINPLLIASLLSSLGPKKSRGISAATALAPLAPSAPLPAPAPPVARPGAPIGSTSPATQTRTQFGGNFARPPTATRTQLCECKPRAKRDPNKKRKPPRVCVSQATARRAGLKRKRA